MQLDDITLPENIYWSDEFDFLPVAQSAERSVYGGMIIESQALMYGQIITLTGAWVSRSEVIALRTYQANCDTIRTLTLNDGVTTYSVVFDIESGGVEATQLMPEINPGDETLYKLTLHLMTVESA